MLQVDTPLLFLLLVLLLKQDQHAVPILYHCVGSIAQRSFSNVFFHYAYLKRCRLPAAVAVSVARSPPTWICSSTSQLQARAGWRTVWLVHQAGAAWETHKVNCSKPFANVTLANGKALSTNAYDESAEVSCMSHSIFWLVIGWVVGLWRISERYRGSSGTYFVYLEKKIVLFCVLWMYTQHYFMCKDSMIFEARLRLVSAQQLH